MAVLVDPQLAPVAVHDGVHVRQITVETDLARVPCFFNQVVQAQGVILLKRRLKRSTHSLPALQLSESLTECFLLGLLDQGQLRIHFLRLF